MVEEEIRNSSDSDTDEEEENSNPSSNEDHGSNGGGGVKGITEYEKQRLSRIKENKARLESLGLTSLASSLLGSVKNPQKSKTPKGKGKGKKDKDDEYMPEEEDRVSSATEEDEDEDEEEFQVKSKRSSRVRRKGKAKSSLCRSGTNKKVPIQNLVGRSDFVDDDEALQQAIALSLGTSSEMSAEVLGGPPGNSRRDASNVGSIERKRDALGQKNDKRNKRRKPNSSRVQMTEDQVVIHFFQFDEAGKGNITLKDLQRMAGAHDFTWTDKEIAAMIYCFDSDGDGKLNLEDFRKILHRCNMIQGVENASA